MSSIRRRLTQSLLLTLVALILGAGVAAYFSARAFLLAEFDSNLRVRARSLVALVEREQGRLEFEFSDDLLSDFDSAAGQDAFEIWLESGEVLTRSHSLQGGDLPRNPVAEGAEAIYDLDLPGNRTARAISVAFQPRASEEIQEGVHSVAQSTGPALQMIVALDRHKLDAAVGSFARGIVLMEGVLLAAVFVLVRAGIRHGLSPLDELAVEVDSIDDASLDRRLRVEGQPTEVRGVRRKLNELLERLQMAFDRERRFSSAAAHELRTPISELRAMTEVALKWPGERSDAERTKDLTETHAIACEMEGLVDALLAIARNGRDEAGAVREAFLIGPILDSARDAIAGQASSRRIEVSIDVPEGTSVHASRVPLQALIRNLAENAIEYAPPRSHVRFSARVEGSRVLIEFTNEDSTLTEADLPHLFEPFWRKDESRTGSRHSGLGLSVCETLARAIEASLAVRLQPPGHVTFTIVVPSAIESPRISLSAYADSRAG